MIAEGCRRVWRGAGDCTAQGYYYIATGRSETTTTTTTTTTTNTNTNTTTTIQSENIKLYEQRIVNDCTVRMLPGWVVTTRHSPRNLAHVLRVGGEYK